MPSSAIASVLLVTLALSACGGGGPAEPSITAADRQAAQLKFETLCFTCHGKTGMGDGPGSAALTPKPRNLRDATWQSSVTDQHIEKIIVSGGAAVGLSPAMPSNPDLKEKPGVVAALREHIRSLRQ
jgi:mono/diheme cytochrome c family protein